MAKKKTMLLKANNQTVDFFDFDYSKYKKMGVSLSGGSDSALLFYLMAKHLKNVQIVPWSAYEQSDDPLRERPLTIEAAEKIVDWIRNQFPNANISNHFKYVYDRTCPETFKEAEKLNTPEYKYYPMPTLGIVKVLLVHKGVSKMWEEGHIDFFANGITSNPPLDVMKDWRHYEERRSRKSDIFEYDKRPGKICESRIYYKPFVNINKKWVAGMFEQEGLMDTLFPLTESCTGFAQDTNWWTEPCRDCFWCNEKYWAFGCYDGGVQ